MTTRFDCFIRMIIGLALCGMVPLCAAKSGSEKEKAFQRMAAFSDAQQLFDQDVVPEHVIESEKKVDSWFSHDNGQNMPRSRRKHFSAGELNTPGDDVEIVRTRGESFSVPLSGAVTPSLPGMIDDDEDKNLKQLSLQVKILNDQVFKLKNAVEESSYAGLDSVSQRGLNLSDQVAELSQKLNTLSSDFFTQLQAQQKTISDLMFQLEKVCSRCGSVDQVDSVVNKPKIEKPVKSRSSWWKRFMCCCGTCEGDVKEKNENVHQNGSQSSISESSQRPESFVPSSPTTELQSNVES